MSCGDPGELSRDLLGPAYDEEYVLLTRCYFQIFVVRSTLMTQLHNLL
ncbi:MAG: hypothetical protein ACI9QQ_002544, partial [Myxococcota bacterium]